MYYEGEGVSQDYKKAAEWFTKAAEQGNARAQNMLACMYYEGKGVSEHYVESYKWAILAGKNGEVVSSIKDSLRKQMTPAQIAQAQNQAKQFVIKRKGDTSSDK